MRKPSHHVRPRVEVMESRALLSTLAPLSTPHHLESRELSSAVAPLSTPHHVDNCVAGSRSHLHQQFPRASVRIKNEVVYNRSGLAIKVTAELFKNSQRIDMSKPKSIAYGHREEFNFGHGPSGLSWEIKINVVRDTGSPPPVPSSGLSLVKNSNGGYDGKIFTITFNGTNFSVSS
jgi:hypothetical protein